MWGFGGHSVRIFDTNHKTVPQVKQFKKIIKQIDSVLLQCVVVHYPQWIQMSNMARSNGIAQFGLYFMLDWDHVLIGSKKTNQAKNMRQIRPSYSIPKSRFNNLIYLSVNNDLDQNLPSVKFYVSKKLYSISSFKHQ